jgi:phosphohistidine phosphatase
VRSRETAELLCAALAPHTTWREVAGLLPEDAPDALAARLSALAPATTLAVVGHEPQLSALATWLVCGRAEPIAFEFKKAAVLTLACETTPALGAFFACWHLPPELLPG